MSGQNQHNQEGILTFGIEFEFMVVNRIFGTLDPHPRDTRYAFPPAMFAKSAGVSAAERAQSYVVALLKDNNIPALSDILFNDVDYEVEDSDRGDLGYLLTEAQKQEVIVEPERIATHAFWVVSEDVGITTIDSQDITGYEFVGMELASRVLKETQFGEVERVYSLIKSNLRTQVNISCGLHIHVGINHLSLESAKKLVTLLMILEEKGLFKEICAPHRANSGWCDPISERSRAVMCGGHQSRDLANARLAVHVPQVYNGVSAALCAGLKHIWNCKTIDAIATETRVHGGHLTFNEDETWCDRGGFAIRNTTTGLGIDGELALGDITIEFRYKESTGSARQDRHWLELCLGFVRAAEWSVEQFQRAMWELHEARNLEGNLASLGLEESEVRWWLGIARHHREHPSPARITRFLAAE